MGSVAAGRRAVQSGAAVATAAVRFRRADTKLELAHASSRENSNGRRFRVQVATPASPLIVMSFLLKSLFPATTRLMASQIRVSPLL